MMRRLLELGLVALTLVGLYCVWQSGQARSAARSEYERLVRLTGDLSLNDPEKIHVLAIETGEPLHFAWRIYVPANCHIRTRYSSGSSSSFQSDPRHFIARVRLREHPPGRLQLYTNFAGGSGQMGFGDESLARFLRGRWDQVQVEQLGAGGKAALLGREEGAVLLRLTLPDELMDEAAGNVDFRRLQEKPPLLFEMHIGPPRPQP